MLLGEETIVLHKRASQWYAQAGLVNEAIQHALTAADYATAVHLLENHAMGLIMQGYAKTVNGWVEAIPAQQPWQSPRTNLAFAWMHLLRGAYAQAIPYLERLESTFTSPQVSEEDKRAFKAEWLVMQSLRLNKEGEFTAGLALANEALEIMSGQDKRVRSLAYFARATAHEAVGDDQAAMDAYQQAVQYAQAAGNLVAEMLGTSGLAVMAFERGQLHLAQAIAAPVSERTEQAKSLPPITAVVQGILGEVYYQWVQIEKAQQHARRTLQLSTLGGYQSGLINCRTLLSRLSQLTGDLQTAAHEIQTAVDLLRLETPDYVRQEAVAQQVRLSLACGHPAAAEMALQREGFSFQGQTVFPEFPSEQRISHSLGLLYNSSLRFLLYMVRNGRSPNNASAGIELANHLVNTALGSQQILIALEAYLLRGQMQAALGSPQASRADYARALELAEPEGFIGVFVEQGQPVADALRELSRHKPDPIASTAFARRILDAFAQLCPPDTAGQASTLVESLSERELEVLHLMADGLKYKEIADQLFISLNTVRFHVKAIYGKLNVNNRTQAIETARQQKIL